MENKTENKFEFTYQAPTKSQREQIEDIRKSYMPKTQDESKLEQLKKLDCKVKNIPVIWSLSIGILGILVFGLGMTMVLEWALFAFGVVVCVVGSVIMAVAYPVYKKIKMKFTKKYSGEILRLSDELLNENK